MTIFKVIYEKIIKFYYNWIDLSDFDSGSFKIFFHSDPWISRHRKKCARTSTMPIRLFSHRYFTNLVNLCLADTCFYAENLLSSSFKFFRASSAPVQGGSPTILLLYIHALLIQLHQSIMLFIAPDWRWGRVDRNEWCIWQFQQEYVQFPEQHC